MASDRGLVQGVSAVGGDRLCTLASGSPRRKVSGARCSSAPGGNPEFCQNPPIWARFDEFSANLADSGSKLASVETIWPIWARFRPIPLEFGKLWRPPRTRDGAWRAGRRSREQSAKAVRARQSGGWVPGRARGLRTERMRMGSPDPSSNEVRRWWRHPPSQQSSFLAGLYCKERRTQYEFKSLASWALLGRPLTLLVTSHKFEPLVRARPPNTGTSTA